MVNTMTFSLWMALLALGFIVVAYLATRLQLALLRRSGQYPPPGQATMADVERLLKDGKRVWAVRCYRELHGCSLRQARNAVAALPV